MHFSKKKNLFNHILTPGSTRQRATQAGGAQSRVRPARCPSRGPRRAGPGGAGRSQRTVGDTAKPGLGGAARAPAHAACRGPPVRAASCAGAVCGGPCVILKCETRRPSSGNPSERRPLGCAGFQSGSWGQAARAARAPGPRDADAAHLEEVADQRRAGSVPESAGRLVSARLRPRGPRFLKRAEMKRYRGLRQHGRSPREGRPGSPQPPSPAHAGPGHPPEPWL